MTQHKARIARVGNQIKGEAPAHLRLLHVEDRESDASLIQRILEKGGRNVRAERVEDAAEMRAALARQSWDIIICDYSLPEFDAPAALHILHESGLDIPFIVVSGAIGEDIAVGMMRQGAHDYLMKDNLARLPVAVEREIAEARVRMERKQAQGALRENEALLRAVCDNTADYIVLKDAAGRIAFANPAALHAIGKSACEVIGQTDLALFSDKALASAIIENDRHVMEHGVTATVEETMQTPEGVRTFHSTKAPWMDDNGQVVGVVAISRDVTERKRVQEELLRSEQRERQRANELAAIMDALPLTTFISRDPECRTIMGSRRTYETLRLNAGTNLSKSACGTGKFRITRGGVDVPPEDLPMQLAARTCRAVENYCCEFVLEDGICRQMLGNAVPLLDADGKSRGSVGAFTDVTEFKQVEARLREAQRLESIGLLAGGIAHDFNNILTAVTGNIGLAMDELCPGCHIDSFLNVAIESAQRAAGLTRELLAYAGKGAFVKKPVSVSAAGSDAVKSVRASATKNIQIHTDFAAALPPVMMDPGQMSQLFNNLILNAAEAIDPSREGEVKVSACLDDGFIRIVVQDNGAGMDDTVKSQMFEPFFTTKFVGRGLGLAAVNGIVQACGGSIAVESELGRGSRFEVRLPVFHPAPVTAGKKPCIPPQPAGAGDAVLIVDDEPSIRKLIGRFLKKHGIPCLEASSGQEAIEWVKMHGSSIRAIVLDVVMPGMTGDEALLEILQMQPHIRVVVSSGYNQAEVSRQFTGLEVYSFLPKPYTGEQLLGHILPAVVLTSK
jgi:two-component system cell cycle sensor histidine kinase/response regulator CckA